MLLIYTNNKKLSRMHSLIQITKLNDFIFCPRSLYLHSIYDNFSQKVYHRTPQSVGKLKHDNIDKEQYSTAKRYLQGLEVASEKYGLVGKIDIYDTEKMELIERKNKVKQIYDGYRYQLYTQMFCLREMGYVVKKLFIHSLSDNKRYAIALPDKKEKEKFKKLIADIQHFNLTDFKQKNHNKCEQCVYQELCRNL